MALRFFAKLPAKAQIALAKTLAATAPASFSERVRNPVFVVGCGRSGTTLLNRTLDDHPEIANYPSEANELWHPRLYPWHKSTVDVPPFWADSHMFTRRSLELRTRDDDRRLKAIFGAYQVLSGGRCFLNKTVMVTFMLPHVLKLFPDAKFIHLYRDGRAVALSYAVKEQPKIEQHPRYAAHGYTLSFEEMLEKLAIHWKQHLLELEKQKQALGLLESRLILEMSYEALCNDPYVHLARLADFLGIAENTFMQTDYSHIRPTNYKYRETLSFETVRHLTGIMAPALNLKEYDISLQPRDVRSQSE